MQSVSIRINHLLFFEVHMIQMIKKKIYLLKLPVIPSHFFKGWFDVISGNWKAADYLSLARHVQKNVFLHHIIGPLARRTAHAVLRTT